MTSALSRLFRDARTKAGLDRREVVMLAGYKNIVKGIRRLDYIEQGKDWFPRQELLERFSAVLDIDEADVIQAMSLDFFHLDEPVLPTISVRLLPAYYARLRLPRDCTTKEATEMAVEYAKKYKLHVWVALSHIRSLAVTPSGQCREIYGGMVCSFGRFGRNALRLAKQMSRVIRENPTQGDE